MPERDNDLSYEQTKAAIHNLTHHRFLFVRKHLKASFFQSPNSQYRKESDIPRNAQRLEDRLYQPPEEDCD